jgi:hypothetical protein
MGNTRLHVRPGAPNVVLEHSTRQRALHATAVLPVDTRIGKDEQCASTAHLPNIKTKRNTTSVINAQMANGPQATLVKPHARRFQRHSLRLTQHHTLLRLLHHPRPLDASLVNSGPVLQQPATFAQAESILARTMQLHAQVALEANTPKSRTHHRAHHALEVDSLLMQPSRAQLAPVVRFRRQTQLHADSVRLENSTPALARLVLSAAQVLTTSGNKSRVAFTVLQGNTKTKQHFTNARLVRPVNGAQILPRSVRIVH